LEPNILRIYSLHWLGLNPRLFSIPLWWASGVPRRKEVVAVCFAHLPQLSVTISTEKKDQKKKKSKPARMLKQNPEDKWPFIFRIFFETKLS